MATTGHENEHITVEGLKASLQQYKTIISDNKLDASLKGAPNGVAELDEDGKVLLSQIPSYIISSMYGIRWTDANRTPVRIGNDNLHKLLPIQSLMKRCIKTATGFKYIDSTDYTKYEDGTTVDYLNDGDLFVHIPAYWYKATSESKNGTIQRELQIWTSYVDGCKLSKEVYIGAVEASSDDASNSSTPSLYSIIKTNIIYENDGSISETNLTYPADAANYRGGSARSASTADGTTATRLGRPVTNLSRGAFRTRASRRGTGFSQQYWDAYMAWVRLYVVEYCNFNSQATYNADKTSDGYMQGGLGSGVSTIDDSALSSFNSYNPFVPCGATIRLGNDTGVVSYTNGTFTVSVPSYRGIENPFGHIFKWTDGINCYGNTSTKDFYTCSDITKFADDTSTNYTLRGSSSVLTNGYISDWIWDENGDFLPTATSGSSSTYLYDYAYLGNTGWRVLLSGGSAYVGAGCGLFCFVAVRASSYALAAIGGRLCYTPSSI